MNISNIIIYLILVSIFMSIGGYVIFPQHAWFFMMIVGADALFMLLFIIAAIRRNVYH